MDGHPILSVFLDELQQQVGFFQTPLVFLDSVDKFGNEGIDLLLFVSLIFLVRMRTFLLSWLLIIGFILNLLTISSAPLLFSALFILLLASWFEFIVDADLFEVMVGQ